MSWNPEFWIKKEDFLKLESKLSNYNVWEFTIADIKGVVLTAGSCSEPHRELHEIIENVPHYILNSEEIGCDNCVTWGKQLYEYQYEE